MSRHPKIRMEEQDKLNELKFEMCMIIDKELSYHRVSQRGQKYAAAYLGTSQANISRVVRKKVEQLTFNQLFRYLIALRPDVRIMFSTY